MLIKISNKKGMYLNTITLIMLTLILTGALLKLMSIDDKIKDLPIGSRQYELIKTYQRAEKALLYIDISSEYAGYETAYELGQTGGIKESECGEYNGYSLWTVHKENGGLKSCYPAQEQLKKDFSSIFSEKLDSYLINYKDIWIPRDNYDLELKDKLTIIGLPHLRLKIVSGKGLQEDISEGEFINKVEQKENTGLEKIYGSTEEEVRKQLVEVDFAGKKIMVHKKAAPAFVKVNEQIKVCEEAKEYDFYSIGTFNWRSMRGSTKRSLHSYGIAIDINPAENPMCPGYDPKNLCNGENKLVTDIPKCVIQAFLDNGFSWGGAWKSKKDSMHFEYLGEPFLEEEQEEKWTNGLEENE